MLEREVGILLISLSRNFILGMRQRFKKTDMDIKPPQFVALKVISLSNPCTPQILADSLFKDKTQITRLIKDLIVKDIIKKESSPTDKRSQILSLTKKGEGYLKKMILIEQRLVREMIKDCEVESIKQWQETTRKMDKKLTTLKS